MRANIPTEKANFPNCDSNCFNDNIVGYILPAESIRVLTNPLRDDQVYVIDIFSLLHFLDIEKVEIETISYLVDQGQLRGHSFHQMLFSGLVSFLVLLLQSFDPVIGLL